MRCHAYTLVEVLAVTVLLGLLAGLGAPPMLRAIAGDPLERAAARLNQAFRDARAQAYGRPLACDLETWGFTAVAGDGDARSALPEARLPAGILAAWSRDRRPVRRLDLDPRGHGLDTVVTLRQDDRELRFTIDGLTGRWEPGAAP